MAVAEKVAIQGIDVSGYLVKDVDRAKKFWQDTMGCAMTMDYGPFGGEFTFGDDTTFAIYKPEDQPWRQGGGLMFRVDDLKAAVDHYKSRGVTFDDDGKIEETPVCSMAFAQDSEGNYFMLHKRKA
ncbi:MAG TPA: VOC family protein [Candidatus Eremiobacteraceae bacterium]|nr:VOC family protein [Candidatus Eremiobacteraceae bacterium]